jgi:hypothetical protein
LQAETTDITLKVESLFTTSLHLSDFVQTQNEAKILTAMNKLLQHDLISCNGPKKMNKICDSCQVAKSKKLPFPDSHRISTHPLELIHSDVWTSRIVSLGGCKYYVLFVDDYSRFSRIYPLKVKSDVLSYFINFKNLIENLFFSSIKHLVTDNGGEYTSMAFKHFTKHMAFYIGSLAPIPPNRMESPSQNIDTSLKQPYLFLLNLILPSTIG